MKNEFGKGINNGINNPMFGKKHTEEAKKKMSDKKRGLYLGDKNPAWKGGRMIDKDGYVLLYTGKRKYVREHRYTMEQHLDRKLTSDEVVHHRDMNKQNNKIENLELFSSEKEHAKNRRHPQETKQKISSKLIGRVFSEKHKQKISIKLRGNKNAQKK